MPVSCPLAGALPSHVPQTCAPSAPVQKSSSTRAPRGGGRGGASSATGSASVTTTAAATRLACSSVSPGPIVVVLPRTDAVTANSTVPSATMATGWSLTPSSGWRNPRYLSPSIVSLTFQPAPDDGLDVAPVTASNPTIGSPSV